MFTNSHKLGFFFNLGMNDKHVRWTCTVLGACSSSVWQRRTSPAVVIAYLMKSRRWTFDQSYQWVKERRPSVDLNEVATRVCTEDSDDSGGQWWWWWRWRSATDLRPTFNQPSQLSTPLQPPPPFSLVHTSLSQTSSLLGRLLRLRTPRKIWCRLGLIM
ncbi:putative protein-tyrosine-phosphatase [Helianthus debilis subsp. tardiflorus]